MHNRDWETCVHDEALCRELAWQLGVSPLLASLLVNRGVYEPGRARAFLDPRPEHLADPFELPDMERAAERVARAVRDREKILVYGDYDADGITAAALLTRFLRRLGHPVATLLPCRSGQGYGLHPAVLEAPECRDARLIVTVDCGSESHEAAAAILGAGLDLVVTDHHQPHAGRRLPEAVPNVNPQVGWHDELKSLSGVGVAWELARATTRRLGARAPFGEEALADYLDLVAVGALADRAPMRGQGRILTRLGLDKLRRDPCPAFRELCRQAGVAPGRADSRTVSFVLAPRINAAGRMLQARVALDLMLAEDEDGIERLAGELDALNRERRKLERRTQADAARIIEAHGLDGHPVIVVHDESWGAGISGVTGIVANHLTRCYDRPAIVLCRAPEGRAGANMLVGSGRCDNGMNLFALVAGCPGGLLEDYGGHHAAVGVTLAADRLDEFRRALAEGAARASVRAGALRVEAVLGLAEVTRELIEEIGRLAPHGSENEEPVLASEGLEVQQFSRVVGKNHLKLWVRDGAELRQGIGFNLGALNARLGAGTVVDLAYTPRISSYEGMEELEMEIKGIRAR